ncbi:nucleotide-binding universal stress UspA family protein [Streptomyces sp. SAI-135]|jgi:nucleotide-binding universal stress UspA family protein|uniref:universal stress protein n=1 Tax=unclassified Streptomyces TaxID=2593676 RepID=UPI00247347BD|nr:MULTISPECIES: universal stress protein [unclassified Streptomyces]MDH6514802.1 nucleotide-binding universal stress UspA family protein [Streptomyces sp. SAI-090]MDH6546984.1 nucleotide-binding universal stress UspA family protein [Streptomyces sp. SAI-041]MDH6621116.1 nucleotide-binding universal stress UspA family protein [Streptomyces sp. SAI-135]
MTGPVVVGLDGSPASVTATWWAARAAMERRLPVLLVHSWTTQPLNVPIPQEALSKQRYGSQVLHRMEAELLHRHADLKLTTELVSAPASKALVDLGDSAAMLVLGSRGHGSVASFLLGSVSLHVLGLARCPAVTVRANGSDDRTDRYEIVVGVQEAGAVSDPLLEFAFTAAEARGQRVRAVRALPLSSLVTHPRGTHQDEGYEVDEQARLAAAVAPWREKFPAVAVTYEVSRGTAAQVLLAASAHSALTVVGRQRHPSPLSWKLGPVAHAALHHVSCPVAVVPHD